jgi:hypothetical protein
VRAGGLLRYVVMLTNPSSRPVRFRDCPGYTQGLYTPTAQRRGSYRLNCIPVGSIAPGASAAFAIELRVPRRATIGSAKLSWNLDTPSGPFAGGIVSVDG